MEHKHSLRDAVISKIKSGEAHMKPKWHFVLNTVLAVVGIVLVVLVLLYIASFIVFAMRQTGVWFVPSFGFRGIWLFISSVPWVLVLLGIIFIAVLELLVRHYSFAYRKPLLYSVIGIFGLVIIGTIILMQTELHQGFYRHAQEGDLPIAGPLYREFGMREFDDLHPGTITQLSSEGFTMTTRHDESVTVTITDETRIPPGSSFVVGDEVVVWGERDDDHIDARGIHAMDMRMPRRPGIGPRPPFSGEIPPPDYSRDTQ